MNKKYENYLARKNQEYGDKFDVSDLISRFAKYYGTDTRLKIDVAGEEVTGTIGVTTGWKPTFILMRTKRSLDSCYPLNEKYKIIAIKNSWNKGYITISS